MIESGQDIEHILAKLLKPEGFRKKGKTWHLETPDTIGVINLQRSRFSSCHYLNIGIFVKSLPELAEEFPQDRLLPKSYRCHFQLRLPDLMQDREKGEALFDLNNVGIGSAQREAGIVESIRKYALPLLKNLTSLDAIKAAIRKDPQLGYATFGELRKIVGQPKVKPRWQYNA